MKTWLTWLALGLLVVAVAGPVGAQEQQPSEPQPTAEATAPEETETMITDTNPTPSGSPTAPAERVEATVEQLEQLINAPPQARLGREVDEPDRPFALFSDKKRVTELLGEEPRYVYIPFGTDPMILPWIRSRVMAAELVTEARELLVSGKYDEALGKVDLVLERFGETDSVEKARQLKIQIEQYKQSQMPQQVSAEVREKNLPPKPTPKPLPSWIPENTRGVVFDVKDPRNSTVLIGEYILHVGDAIPSFPGIKIVDITKSMITLDYQGETFRLKVEGN